MADLRPLTVEGAARPYLAQFRGERGQTDVGRFRLRDGQIARLRDYFAELPSETLRRARMC